MVCFKLCPWWKSKCQSHCQHTKEYITSTRCVNVFGPPTGVVISSYVTKSGARAVNVRSFEQFQTGNKISMGHGQKGVVTVIPFQDMPIVELEDGSTIVPDLVMAMSSIIMRQTAGQLFETQAGLDALRKCEIPSIADVGDVPAEMQDFYVVNPCTGRRYRSILRRIANGEVVIAETRGSMGFMRVFNQSQMTREKAGHQDHTHYAHLYVPPGVVV